MVITVGLGNADNGRYRLYDTLCAKTRAKRHALMLWKSHTYEPVSIEPNEARPNATRVSPMRKDLALTTDCLSIKTSADAASPAPRDLVVAPTADALCEVCKLHASLGRPFKFSLAFAIDAHEAQRTAVVLHSLLPDSCSDLCFADPWISAAATAVSRPLPSPSATQRKIITDQLLICMATDFFQGIPFALCSVAMPHVALRVDSTSILPQAAENEIIQWLSTQQDETSGLNPLYEDPDFPSTELSSLYIDPTKLPDYVPQQNSTVYSERPAGSVYWYRPTEYTENPDYFKSSTGCGVIREGQLNDAWLLGVFAAVALHPDNLIENLFVSESLNAFKQFGVVTCRFYKDDQWVTVTTDTKIPYSMELKLDDRPSGTFTPPGSVLYGGSVDKNEVFIPLLEKAYAKLHGSYQTLDEKHGGGIGGSAGTSSGRILEAFLDCTGGSAHRVDLQQERVKQLQFDQLNAGTAATSPTALLWKQMLRYKRKKCILTTQLRQLSFNAQDVTAMGIVKNRQYVIQHVTEVGLPTAGGSGATGSSSSGHQAPHAVLRFVKLKTVWGRGMWKGEWSNDDSKWEEHTQIEQAMRSDPRCEFSRSGHDGCFWMVFEDLLDTFTELFVVHVFTPDVHQYNVRGDWVGTTAAGAPAKTSIGVALPPATGDDHNQNGQVSRLKENSIEKTRWAWIQDADPNWHRNPQFKLSIPPQTLTINGGDASDKPVNGVLVSLAQRDFRLYGGDNYAVNLVLLREKLSLAAAASSDPPPAIWEFKRTHVVAEAHSYETSAPGIDATGITTTPATPATPSLAHPATPLTGGVSGNGGMNTGSGGQPKALPERELVKEDIVLSPGAAYYLIPYTTNPKVEMEFFLRVVTPRPVRVERVPPILSVIRTGRWRVDSGSTPSGEAAGASEENANAVETTTAGGPLLLLPLPQAHVAGEENPSWCQNPQFWVRFAERSPRERRRLRKLLAAKAYVTIKVILRKTSHRALLGNKSRQQREAAKDRANFVGITAVRVVSHAAPPQVVVGGSGSSAATQLRAHTKGQKTNFLGEIVESPYAKANAISKASIRSTKIRNNHRIDTEDEDAENDSEPPAQIDAQSGVPPSNFPPPKFFVKPTEWCRLSSYSSPALACLYLRKLSKEWLLASDSQSAVNSSGGGGLLLVPTLGEPGIEGSFELQIDCDFPLLVDELPKGAGAVQSVPGEWTASLSGGCHLHTDWRQNPKFYLQMQGVRPSKVRITLTRSELEWRSRCQRDSVGSMIGFYLFRGGSGKFNRPGDSEGGDSNSASNHIMINGRPWSETDFVPLHTVSSPPDLVLSAAAKGGYVIIPTTYEPGRLGKFVLSVQCDTEFSLTCDPE